jgi:hypothetical protein
VPEVTTLALVVETDPEKTDDWAAASWVTLKLKLPAGAPAEAVAATLASLDVVAIASQADAEESASDAVCNATILVLMFW